MANNGVYEQFYQRANGSATFSRYCTEVYGIDLTQDGFADKAQLDYLLSFIHFNKNDNGLDIGCGNGRMCDYITRQTGSSMTGLDSSSAAIDWARRMTGGNTKLDFVPGDINHPDIPQDRFSVVILVDTIYFSDDYLKTLEHLYDRLLPGGRIGIFYSDFVLDAKARKEKISGDDTEVAKVIAAKGWDSKNVDFTDQHFDLMKRKRTVSAKYRLEFEAEHNEALFQKVRDESVDEDMSMDDFEIFSNRHLYCIYKPNDR